MAKLRKLNIKSYPENAAKNTKWYRLIIRTLLAAGLSFALIYTTITQQYDAKASIFCLIGIIIIVFYFVLNVLAIITKILMNKNKD